MRKTLRKRNNKNKKSKKYGGFRYTLGTTTRVADMPGSTITRYALSDQITPIEPKVSKLPEVIETNLSRVDTSPNRSNDYRYHSLFLSRIHINDVNDLIVINKVINNKFLSIVEELNRTKTVSTSNTNVRQNLRKEYTVNDIKLNDFSIQFINNNDPNTIFIQGKMYVTDFNKINKPLRANLVGKLNEDVVGEIAQYSTG